MPRNRDIPPELNVHILENTPNMVPVIFRSRTIGGPPLIPTIPVWPGIRDAAARIGDYKPFPKLDAPTTPEVMEDMKRQAAKAAAS